jgi:predicted anti-sigma-YlaC factor YlaD
MKCSIHRWNISRALDSGEPLGSLTKLHLVHCEACREFSRLAEEMGLRLTDDATSLLGDERPGLGERVRRALDAQGEAPSPLLPRPKRFRLSPVLAAAVALAVVGASLIWMVRSRPARMPRLEPLFRLETQRAYLVSALQRAESPYQEEIQELKKTLKSTADYLAARFDIGLGENH